MDSVQVSARAPDVTGDTPGSALGLQPRPPQADAEGSLVAERERIARVLHDDVMQAFAVCLLKAQLCQRLQGKKEYALAAKELGLLEDALNETIDRVRDLTATLRR
ncbi:MAG: histidine kinase [Chloroflexi bacterium]|nr:histidine kinase [Chloroflexota bacterium]